jgi:hypothetical protein
LPQPQPVNPDALATVQQPQESEEPPTPPRPPRRRGPPAVSQPKPDAQASAPVTAAPAATAEPERPPVQEIVPIPEQKRLQDSAESRKKDIRQWLEKVQSRRLNAHERTIVSRIQSFLALSDEAQAAGDMRKADELAQRAQVLTQEFPSGK